MSFDDATLAHRLEEVASLLEEQRANLCRVRAYRNAAVTLPGIGSRAAELLPDGLAMRFVPPPPRAEPAGGWHEPPVADLLAVVRGNRERARQGALRTIAPRRWRLDGSGRRRRRPPADR